jgi:hypothetical protein
MVGFDMDARSDRAQLILVGAVAIAFIVLGLAVVFNTVLYTENVASTGAASEPRDAQLLNKQVRVGSAGLVDRVNANASWESQTDAYDALKENISKYSSGLANVTGASKPVSVAVEEGSQADAEYAARIEQDDGTEFTNIVGTKNWSMTTGSPGSTVIVRNFDMVVDSNSLGDETEDEAFRVVWQDSSGDDTYTLWIYEDDSSGDIAIRTLTDDETASPITDFGSEGSDECVLSGSSSSEVAFNISDGQIRGYDDCSEELNVSKGIPDGERRSVQFVRGDNVTGDYSMVVWQGGSSPSTYISPDVAPPVDAGTIDPHWAYAIWEFEATTSYDSGSVSFEETSVIEVYNRSR